MKIRGVEPAKRKSRALALLRQLRLPESYYTKSVQKCSGGERQRVALARALAYNPEILFFDEPLSALDYKLRKALEKELKDIHRETGKTFVYITHSLEEAMVMSDRIGVMRAGKLVQVGTPNEIYSSPRSKFVSEFMGDVNVIAVKSTGNGSLLAPSLEAKFTAPPGAPQIESGHLVIRPEYVRFLGKADEAANTLSGRLYNEYALGSRIQYQVRVGDQVFVVEKLRQQAYKGNLDDQVLIGWDSQHSILVGEE
jgi:spermidine/putrescine transport system ATP-binding protein